MFINYDEYWEYYTHQSEHPSYEYIIDNSNLASTVDFICPLYYAGWPYGEIWKYNCHSFYEEGFMFYDICNIPKFNYDNHYFCCVRAEFDNEYLDKGNLAKEYVSKWFSYNKDNIRCAIENYRTKDDNVYQVYFEKNNEFIFGRKAENEEWEFFTDKKDIEHFNVTIMCNDFILGSISE